MQEAEVQQHLKTITDTIVRRFHPERIILFGSWAWGTPGPDSDIDLFVIKETTQSTRGVARDIDGALWGRRVPLDILVYTPKGVKRRLDRGDFFVRDVIQKGKVLYERS